MLGTVCQSHTSALQTLKRIKAAGYDGLELNRFMIHPSSLMVRLMTRAAGMPTGSGGRLDWHELLSQSELEVLSLHTDLGSLERDPEGIIEEARSFKTSRIVITGMYRFDYGEEGAVLDLCRRLNQSGELLRGEGMELLYHNHNVELVEIQRGVKAYDRLLAATDPDKVGFEFDSFWFADAGADVKHWMKKLSGRMKLWHITDRGYRGKGPFMTPILKMDSVELGYGNMDLEGLREIALANGTEGIVLESHKNWVDKDPVKSLELSAGWLKERF